VIHGISGIYYDDVIADLADAVPRNSVFLRRFEGKYTLVLRNDDGNDLAAVKVDFHIADTTKPCSRTYIYDLLAPKVAQGGKTFFHVRELCR